MQIVSGQTNVRRMVENAIDSELFFSEIPQIRQVVPYDWDVVYDYIFQQMMGSMKNLVFQDIVSFPETCSEADADQSLQAFKKLVALSLMNNVDHQSRFYYRSSDGLQVDGGIFPWLLWPKIPRCSNADLNLSMAKPAVQNAVGFLFVKYERCSSKYKHQCDKCHGNYLRSWIQSS